MAIRICHKSIQIQLFEESVKLIGLDSIDLNNAESLM